MPAERTISIDISLTESQFNELVNKPFELTNALKKAFETAAAELDRKENRNAIINYFDLASDLAGVRIPTIGGMLSLKK